MSTKEETPINGAKVESNVETPSAAIATDDDKPQTNSSNLNTSETTGEISNGSSGAPDEDATAPEAVPEEKKPIDLQKEREAFTATAKTYLTEQSKHVVIPSYSKWFDFDSVHQIEKKSFPDFFPSKTNPDAPKSIYKTPESYKHIRDFLINAYRLNPIEYLTVTAVRRNLAGDVTTVIRIHGFLEKWGLINYQVDPRTKSSLVGPQFTGHFQITLDTPKGLAPFIPESSQITDSKLPSPPASSEEPEDEHKSKVVKDESGIPLNLELRRNVYTELSKDKDNTSNTVQHFCSITNKEISDVRYHNLKSKSYINSSGLNANSASIISPEAFEQGLFPSNFQSSDFVKLSKEEDSAVWGEQEILLLLEGIEMFATYDVQSANLFANNNGQWDRISEHVGTKTREQCLIKFVQLPIEDRYLNKLINSEKSNVKTQGLNKETIIQEVVDRIISNKEGQALLKKNSIENLQETITDQSSLINQVMELTLEKFQTKLNLINNLETNLIKTENLLNLQRKQLLIERWRNFEKIDEFKKHNNHPELNGLLDDLLTPISINEVNKTFNKVNLDDRNTKSNEMEVDNESSENGFANNKDEEILPISVSQPKSYKVWSA